MIIFVSGHQPTFNKFTLNKPRVYYNNANGYLDHQYYCELTAMHEMWKRVLNTDIVGLEHYRRFFVKEKLDPSDLMDEEFASKILSCHDMIMAPNKLPCTVMNWIAKEKHNIKETSNGITKTLMYQWWMYVRDNYSKEFIDYAIQHMFLYNTYMSCNMFIGKKEVFNKYCEFLFPMMEGFFTDVMHGVPEPRIFGYLSEYLFGYWLKWQGYKVYTSKHIFLP